jgi:hypothetical protein
MDWEKVWRYLDSEGFALRQRAEMAFPNDIEVQREMRTRAAIFITFAEELRFGLTSGEAAWQRSSDSVVRHVVRC